MYVNNCKSDETWNVDGGRIFLIQFEKQLTPFARVELFFR